MMSRAMGSLAPEYDGSVPDATAQEISDILFPLKDLSAEMSKTRLVLTKDALTLLYNASQLGTGPCPLSDKLAPQARHAERLELPLVESWMTGELEVSVSDKRTLLN